MIYLLVAVAAQLWLVGYVTWCVRRGFISVHLERIYRSKDPARFMFHLRLCIALAVVLAVLTVYLTLKAS